MSRTPLEAVAKQLQTRGTSLWLTHVPKTARNLSASASALQLVAQKYGALRPRSTSGMAPSPSTAAHFSSFAGVGPLHGASEAAVVSGVHHDDARANVVRSDVLTGPSAVHAGPTSPPARGVATSAATSQQAHAARIPATLYNGVDLDDRFAVRGAIESLASSRQWQPLADLAMAHLRHRREVTTAAAELLHGATGAAARSSSHFFMSGVDIPTVHRAVVLLCADVGRDVEEGGELATAAGLRVDLALTLARQLMAQGMAVPTSVLEVLASAAGPLQDPNRVQAVMELAVRAASVSGQHARVGTASDNASASRPDAAGPVASSSTAAITCHLPRVPPIPGGFGQGQGLMSKLAASVRHLPQAALERGTGEQLLCSLARHMATLGLRTSPAVAAAAMEVAGRCGRHEDVWALFTALEDGAKSRARGDGSGTGSTPRHDASATGTPGGGSPAGTVTPEARRPVVSHGSTQVDPTVADSLLPSTRQLLSLRFHWYPVQAKDGSGAQSNNGAAAGGAPSPGRPALGLEHSLYTTAIRALTYAAQWHVENARRAKQQYRTAADAGNEQSLVAAASPASPVPPPLDPLLSTIRTRVHKVLNGMLSSGQRAQEDTLHALYRLTVLSNPARQEVRPVQLPVRHIGHQARRQRQQQQPSTSDATADKAAELLLTGCEKLGVVPGPDMIATVLRSELSAGRHDVAHALARAVYVVALEHGRAGAKEAGAAEGASSGGSRAERAAAPDVPADTTAVVPHSSSPRPTKAKGPTPVPGTAARLRALVRKGLLHHKAEDLPPPFPVDATDNRRMPLLHLPAMRVPNLQRALLQTFVETRADTMFSSLLLNILEAHQAVAQAQADAGHAVPVMVTNAAGVPVPDPTATAQPAPPSPMDARTLHLVIMRLWGQPRALAHVLQLLFVPSTSAEHSRHDDRHHSSHSDTQANGTTGTSSSPRPYLPAIDALLARDVLVFVAKDVWAQGRAVGRSDGINGAAPTVIDGDHGEGHLSLRPVYNGRAALTTSMAMAIAQNTLSKALEGMGVGMGAMMSDGSDGGVAGTSSSGGDHPEHTKVQPGRVPMAHLRRLVHEARYGPPSTSALARVDDLRALAVLCADARLSALPYGTARWLGGAVDVSPLLALALRPIHATSGGKASAFHAAVMLSSFPSVLRCVMFAQGFGPLLLQSGRGPNTGTNSSGGDGSSQAAAVAALADQSTALYQQLSEHDSPAERLLRAGRALDDLSVAGVGAGWHRGGGQRAVGSGITTAAEQSSGADGAAGTAAAGGEAQSVDASSSAAVATLSGGVTTRQAGTATAGDIHSHVARLAGFSSSEQLAQAEREVLGGLTQAAEHLHELLLEDAEAHRGRKGHAAAGSTQPALNGAGLGHAHHAAPADRPAPDRPRLSSGAPLMASLIAPAAVRWALGYRSTVPGPSVAPLPLDYLRLLTLVQGKSIWAGRMTNGASVADAGGRLRAGRAEQRAGHTAADAAGGRARDAPLEATAGHAPGLVRGRT